jgi:hypothetical protein
VPGEPASPRPAPAAAGSGDGPRTSPWSERCRAGMGRRAEACRARAALYPRRVKLVAHLYLCKCCTLINCGLGRDWQACKIERQINEEVFAPLERDRLKRPK